MSEQATPLDELTAFISDHAALLKKGKLRRLVGGTKYILWRDLSPAAQQLHMQMEQESLEKQLLEHQLEKVASLEELKKLRAESPGEYQWYPRSGKWEKVEKRSRLKRTDTIPLD